MLHALFSFIYLIFFLVFLLIVREVGKELPSIGSFDLLLLCLATFRITELITCDSITRFVREPFVDRRVVTHPDGTKEEKVKPAGRGIRHVLGEILICPWCAGVWVGTFLTYFLLLAPAIARVFLVAFSATAGGILFQLLAKLLDRASDEPPD